MPIALTLVTLMSMTVAVAMAVMTWRLRQEDQRRSAARVAALAALAGEPLAAFADEWPRASASAAAAPGSLSSVGPVASSPLPSAPSLSPTSSGGGGPFFGASTATSTSTSVSASTLMALGGGLLVVMVAGTLLAWSGSSNPSAAARSTLGAPSEAPLELLSLEHTRAAGMLKITGVVRNRGRVGRIAGMSAVVFLFDTTGAFVTSARALVDYPTLAPGEESSFVIAVPGADNVSRYRVSFREDDRVVPHVDRRAARAPSATDSSQAR